MSGIHWTNATFSCGGKLSSIGLLELNMKVVLDVTIFVFVGTFFCCHF